MRSALEAGILKERFRDHDVRARAARDTDRQPAIELTTHQDGQLPGV